MPGSLVSSESGPAAVPTARSAGPRQTHSASPDKRFPEFLDVDLTSRIKGAAGSSDDVHRISPALMDQVAALTDPLFLRRATPTAAGIAGARLPTGLRRTDKDLPWSPDQLLANPTDMDDEYVSIAASPLSGHLFAVFAATDLGGTDRDVHIARSTDDGVTWQVWEMPSFVEDEYHPSLAIDGAGYIHVVWVRDDGYILRSRTTGPDDPTQWAWVKGLAVGEPCATPSVAVSGAGDFAKVFIAAGWLTVNYDYLAYEWTLIFMSSSNGGNSVAYDYFLPDGYADYWPDVAMDGGTVHFVNAEADGYTGETEILIATDVYSGSFSSPASFTGWTSNNTGFPRVACQGSDVFVVYQLDYTDGVTSDGDIIYTYSWDAAGSFFGPYGMVADEYDSVGPAVFVRDGLVGCVWLDAPAGGDEFYLAGRLGSGYGAIEYFGDVELVSEQPRVEPMFHSAAGVLTSDRSHAAWIDRRDFPTQGHNVYTSRRDLQANLAAFTPAGWDSSLIVNMIKGERSDGWIAADDTAWVSFAFLNNGLRDIATDFYIDLELDGRIVASWILEDGLPKGTYVPLEDFPIVAEPGQHTVGVVLDGDGTVPEDDENDNRFERSYSFIVGDPEMRVRPSRLITIITPDMKRADALALAAAPPLRRDVHLTVVSPDLQVAVDDASKSGGSLRVMIVPAERLDPPALGTALKGASRAVRREAVILAARGQTERGLAALQPTLDAYRRLGLAGEPQPLWLSGVIAVDLAPEAVAQIALDPSVGRLWLDDRPCRPFGGPAAGGGVTGDAINETTADKALAWHLGAIRADQAWALGHTGQGVVVGHLDTGAAYDHPDLVNRVWDGGTTYPHHGWDAIDDDNDPYDGDVDWHHGTHTAGLIVGDGSGGTATGSAPGAELMLLRVVPGYYADVVEGLQFGLDNGAQLFNMSAGWTLPPDDVRAANRYNAELLNSIDVPWVCAAGNGDNYGGHSAVPTDIASPGDCPSPWYAPNGNPSAVFTVGGVDQTSGVSTTSSYGPTEWDVDNTYGDTDYRDYPWPEGLMKPDIAAPGVNITSLSGSYGYVAYDGTSMACPLVTGAFSVLLGATPGLTPAQLAETFETTAVDLATAPATPGRDPYTGAGLIDIAAALTGAPAAGDDDLEFEIANYGELPLVIDQMFITATWLSVPQPTGYLAPGASLRLQAMIDPSGLIEGVHEASVLFLGNDPASPVVLPVTLLYGEYTTDVGDRTPTAVAAGLDNHPNPFNPRTTLRFDIPVGGPVRLELFDLRGRSVRVLVDRELTPGLHEVVWDGCDHAGRPLGSGTYVARMRDPGRRVATRKLTLVR